MRKNKNYMYLLVVVICIIIGLFLIWKYITKNKKEGFNNTVNYLDGIEVIYWINLDRSTDRRERMEKLLTDSSFDGIPTERIPAFDGKTNAKGIFDKLLINKKTMTNSEYGCLLSHLETIRKFDESDYNIALILEDDATLEFKKYWNKTVVSIMKDAPPDWDIILLCFITVENIDLNETTNYEIAYHKYYSSMSYLINKNGSRKLMANFSKNKYNIISSYAEPADSYLCKITNAYAYKYPMFIYKTQNSSTIHQSHISIHQKSKFNIINNLQTNNSKYTFHLLMPTMGKDTIFKMLDSLKPQLTPNFYLTIVFDGPNLPNVEKVKRYITDFNCKTNVIVEQTNLGFWGHGIRNKYNNLQGDFIYGIDDDDTVTSDCLQTIQTTCINLNNVYIFKMKWTSGNITWKTKIIKETEIGTCMGVIPMKIMRNHHYELRRGGDYSFYKKISELYNIVFVDKIIYNYST